MTKVEAGDCLFFKALKEFGTIIRIGNNIECEFATIEFINPEGSPDQLKFKTEAIIRNINKGNTILCNDEKKRLEIQLKYL